MARFIQNSKKSPLNKRFFKELRDFWWVGLFCVFTFMLYMQTSRNKAEEVSKLKGYLIALESEKEEALKLHEELKSEIMSQSDPGFIEMILMKKLGVVPEGGMRVQFQKGSLQEMGLGVF